MSKILFYFHKLCANNAFTDFLKKMLDKYTVAYWRVLFKLTHIFFLYVQSPVYTGDDTASIYGDEDAASNHANSYGGGDTTSTTSYGVDKDEEPLEKGRSGKEKKKYLMTKPQRKYMTRNSAGCLVATLCIAMLILVLGAIALFIWLFICKLILFFHFMS